MSRAVLVLLLALAGCASTPPADDLGPVGPTTRTPSSTETFDCGRVRGTARLDVAATCLRDALLDGQPARLVRVAGSGATAVRTTYVVTGRGELAISQTSGSQTRLRRCTHATGLSDLGTCTRDPGSGM